MQCNEASSGSVVDDCQVVTHADGVIQRMLIADVLGESQDNQFVYLPGEEDNSWPGNITFEMWKQKCKNNIFLQDESTSCCILLL